MDPFVTILALMGIVIIVASLLSGALERNAVPIVAVFLALGALLGPFALGVLDVGFGSPELRVIAILALMLVLFSDGVTLNLRELMPRRGLLVRVLGPGTLVPAALIAVAASLLLGMSPPLAAILGAALASTDPVLLRTALRSRAVPDAARIALRMESGLNDIILLPVVVIAMLRSPNIYDDTHHGDSSALLGLFLLGPLLGVVVGWVGITALSQVRRRAGVRRDYESLYALGLAFCAYAAAEAVGGSGFVAAFAAGIMIDAQDAELCECFLEYGEATAEMFLLLTFVALGTTLIWSGLHAMTWRALVFAVIALVVRSAVLYPMLAGLGLAERERRLIALLGPRGLSTLLLVLLPVFAGVAGAESLFAVASTVVLISVVVHGGGVMWFLRSQSPRPAAEATPAVERPSALPVIDGHAEAAGDRITLDELQALQSRGEPVVIADARKDDVYLAGAPQAAGAVRIGPRDPVGDARALGVPREATIAVYCA